MRVAFLGTPDFALPSLKMLVDEGYSVTVFTQPDRKKGRGGKVQFPPVKELAIQLNLPVMQFERISCEDGVKALSESAPDVMVTAAFGQILTQEILDIPKHGCINVHGSLLPKYRGAAPIQQAIINGETETGITTMLTDAGLDTGDILLKRAVEIGENETAGELFERLAELGAQVLKETLDKLKGGTLCRIKQDSSMATKCRMIKKEHGKIDFTRSAVEIHNQVRGMNPWPTAYAYLGDEVIKIHNTVVHKDIHTEAEPGRCITATAKSGLFIATGNGVLEVTKIQLAGGKVMSAKALLNSRSLQGEVLK